MAYGFRARNASGVLQIDGVFRNLQLIDRGTIVPSITIADAGGNIYPMARGRLTFSGLVNPVLVIRCDDPAYYSGNIQSGDTYFFDIYRPKNKSSAVSWWLFDDVKPQGAGWGMNIRNESGEIVYSTAKAPFRVVDYLQPADMPANSIDYAYPSSRTYGYTCARMAERYFVAGSSTITAQQEVSACLAIPGGLRITWQMIQAYVGNPQGAPTTQVYSTFKHSWIVVDVTDL